MIVEQGYGPIRKRGRGFAFGWLIVAGLAMTSQAAVASDMYIGGTIGWATTPVDTNELDDRIVDAGLGGEARDVDTDRLGTSLLLGYRLTPTWSVEAGVTDLGKIDVDFRGLDPGTDANDLRDVRPGSGYGVELATVMGYDFTPVWRGFARVGAFGWRAEYDYEGSSDTADGVDPMAGLGVAWRYRPDWSVHATWTRYTVDDDATHLLGIGVRYRFGDSDR